MKRKVLNLLLLVTSLFGYLEWGADMRTFLFQAELDVLRKIFHDPGSAAHPFVILPMAGQLMLLLTLVMRHPGRWLTYAGMACIGVLLVFMFVIGLLSLNWKIAVSVLPFLIVALVSLSARDRVGQA